MLIHHNRLQDPPISSGSTRANQPEALHSLALEHNTLYLPPHMLQSLEVLLVRCLHYTALYSLIIDYSAGSTI